MRMSRSSEGGSAKSKAHFVHLAVHRSPANLAMAFYDFPFKPSAPVRRQLLALLRDVSAARRQADFQILPTEVLPLRRRIVKPFGEDAATLIPAVPHDLVTLHG
jgi:hypothetical protein